MAQQRFIGEDGTIYEELPGGGYAVVSSGGGQQPYTIGQADPAAQYKAPRASVDLTGANLGNQRTAQQIALEAATAEATRLKAEADARKAAADADKAERDLKTAPAESQAQMDRLSRLNQLARQINRTQFLYNTNIGTTKGIRGLRDLLPTDDNYRFDVAGNQLSQQGLAAFRVPGTGTVSDRDAAMFDRANLPTASTRDAAIDEQLGGIRARVEEEYRTLGKPVPQWQTSVDRTPATALASGGGGNTNPPPPGGSGPAGYDVAGVDGGVSGGGGGGNFASAAGVTMAQRLKAAYNRGAGVQELNKLLQDNGFQPLSDPASIAAIQKRGPISFAPPQADDTRGALGHAVGALADTGFGAYAISAGDALTAGTLDNIAGGQAKLAQEYAAQKFPTASLLGTVTGGALAAGGAELGLARAGLSAGRAALAGDALYGGAYGAGSADGEGDSRLLGGAVGAVGGLAGGVAGRAAARGIGGALTGVQDANVRGLRASGVPLTVGQAAGGALKGVEDRLSGVPVLGNVVQARRLEGMQGFNQAAFREGLAPIGGTTGGVTGEAGIDAAQAATRQGYDNALSGVRVTRDPQFTADYNASVNQGAQVPRVGPEFEAWAQADLDPLTQQPTFDGRTVQDFIQQTRGADFGNDAMGNLVGRSVTGAENAMRGLVNRQAPSVIPALGRADHAYRNVQVLKDAVNRARNGTRVGETGTFAPSQLADAAAANAKKFGNSQGTTRQPFFDLTRAGQAVLPNSVPDSGTAGRLLTQQALAAGGLGVLGGGAGYAGGGEDGAQTVGAGGLALGALLAAGGSRTGQRALTRALLDRPDVAVQLGRGIQNRARLGGLFGAPLLAGTAPMLAQ